MNKASDLRNKMQNTVRTSKAVPKMPVEVEFKQPSSEVKEYKMLSIRAEKDVVVEMEDVLYILKRKHDVKMSKTDFIHFALKEALANVKKKHKIV